jgi:putative Ca2+/H+ antiporter (TMEM165/GDT1 family)
VSRSLRGQAVQEGADAGWIFGPLLNSKMTCVMGQLITIFASVFLAELGDKTQIATLLFASERQNSPAAVFLASAGALTLSCAIAVLLGNFAGRWLHAMPMKLIAGVGFIAIGLWMVVQYYQDH